MIVGYDNILRNIEGFAPGLDFRTPTGTKIDILQETMERSVEEVGEYILAKGDSRIHMGFSGGLDSTVMLYLFMRRSFPVTAYTLFKDPNCPDIVYSKRLAEDLGSRFIHKPVQIIPNSEDLGTSNSILGENKKRPDNYFYLLRALSRDTSMMVNCDCIDELLGGYYAHQDPSELPGFDPDLTLEQNRALAFNHYLSRLDQNNLSPLDKFADYFGVDVFLPYAAGSIFWVASFFKIGELVDDHHRKKPMIEIAKRIGVPDYIINRRKYGFCDAMKDFS